MRSAEFQLKGGKVVYLSRFEIWKTALGVLEGDTRTIVRNALADLPARVKDRFGHECFTIIKPPNAPEGIAAISRQLDPDSHCPTYTCMAEFTWSDPDKHYYLVLCWFVDEIDENLIKLISKAVDAIDPTDWERRAGTYGWDDI